MFAICAILFCRGIPEYGLFSRTLYSTYLHPGALLLIMCLDLLDAPAAISGMAPYPAIIVAPEEREERTKAGTFDQSVLLDDSRGSTLGPDFASSRREEAGRRHHRGGRRRKLALVRRAACQVLGGVAKRRGTPCDEFCQAWWFLSRLILRGTQRMT